jgi:hypothetical protein
MDPACKTAVYWATKSIRRMTRKKALERWETKINNSEVTPQAIWPIAKSRLKRDGPRPPTAIHGPLGLKFLPLEKANASADCVETSSHHMTCVKKTMSCGWRIQLEAVDNNPPERIRPCDLQKLINSLKLR